MQTTISLVVMSGVMTVRISFAAIEVVALLAAAYFGYLWYIEPSENYEPPFAIAAFVLVITDLIRRYVPSKSIDPEKLANFIREGQDLAARLNENPLPIQEHDEWVERMVDYLKKHKEGGYDVRLNDFSGMVFYGDGSERSKMSRSIDGRLRRLHEFISELGSK